MAGAVLALGGILAGLGTLLRAWDGTGNDQWTYLLDTVGLMVVVIGAGLDVRASGPFVQFDEQGSRRRAILQVTGGSAMTGVSCVALGWVADGGWPALVRGAISLTLTLGIGICLAGFLNIGWFSGGDYLERRIAQRSEEEW